MECYFCGKPMESKVMYATHIASDHVALVFAPKKHGVKCLLCGKVYLGDFGAVWHILMKGTIEEHLLESMCE